VGDEPTQPGLFVGEHPAAPRGQAVVRAAAGVVFALGPGGFEDKPLVDELAQMPVKGPGLERNPAAGLLAYRLHYSVAVEIPLGQREKNVKGGGLQVGKHVHIGYVHPMNLETQVQSVRLADIDWDFMRLLRWSARVAGAALIGFHVWLLATQWSAGQLFNDPALIMRWVAALVLAAALLWLSREGTSLVSRRAIVIWLLAALLHAPAIVDRAGDANGLRTLPETAASLLIQSTSIGGLLILTAWLIAGVVRRRTATNTAWSFVRVLALTAFPDDGFSFVVSARPPPQHR